MVSAKLLEAVSALSEDDRLRLVVHIERTLEDDALPTGDQHETVARRVAEMKQDPALGLTLEQAIAAAQDQVA